MRCFFGMHVRAGGRHDYFAGQLLPLGCIALMSLLCHAPGRRQYAVAGRICMPRRRWPMPVVIIIIIFTAVEDAGQHRRRKRLEVEAIGAHRRSR